MRGLEDYRPRPYTKWTRLRRVKMWLDVEFELPDDGEVVEVKVGRHHVMEMRYMADPECWLPYEPKKKIISSGAYPHKVEKWRRRDAQSIDNSKSDKH